METYLGLLKKIKFFAESDFKGVYSRPFAKHVIINSNNPKIKDFSVIYGDFNKLDDINQKYSEKIGDMLMNNTYTTIHEILHEYFPACDFSISRFGGDEFLIVIDSCDKAKLQDCFEYINNILIAERHIPKFVDFSYGIVTSNEEEFDNIFEMINKAEHIQSINKIFPGNNEYTFEESLKIRIERSIDNFFRNFRLSNYIKFDIKNNSRPNTRDIKSFVIALLDNTITLLSNPNRIDELTSRLTEITPISDIYSNNLLSEEQCIELYKHINALVLNSEPLDSVNIGDLYSFLDLLIRDPVSGFYNKSYFSSYFINAFRETRDTFSTAILADATYMKDSNLKIGHSETDNKLKLIGDQLRNGIESIYNRPFSKNNFNINSDNNYIFGLGGGNYFILSRDNINKQQIDKIVNSITPNCRPLGLIYSMENIENRKDLQNILDSLYKNCNAKKLSSKSADLDFSEKSIIETFNIFLSPTLKYYLEENPKDPFNINELKNFMEMLSTSVITQASRQINTDLENDRHSLDSRS